MGKISIKGHAEREVSYDIIELSLGFSSKAKTTEEAIRSVTTQCEDFLRLLKVFGIETSSIHIDDDSLNQRYDNKENLHMYANRNLKMRIDFDMVLLNRIIDAIKQQNYNVYYSCEYLLQNKSELHTELLKEALQDSRAKAEIIAESVGHKIVGIGNLNYRVNNDIVHYRVEEREDFLLSESCASISDHLGAPLTTEEEDIDVEWLIE